MQLRKGVNEELVRGKLAAVPGVQPLEPKAEPFDITSVSSLSRKISHLTQEEKEEKAVAGKRKNEETENGVDYLRAYHYFLSQRAFPNDKINWSAFDLGKLHAAQMTPTRFDSESSGSKTSFTSQTWQFVGPTNLTVPYRTYYGKSPVNGRINAVAYDPNLSSTIYAGGAQGGIWKSPDSGVTWNWLSSSWPQLGVNCIVVDPSNASTIYVGLGDYHGVIPGSYGIMKSTDGGNTWSEIGVSAFGKIGVPKIILDPTNSQTIIAGTGDGNHFGSLYRSTNGGQTWTKLSTGGGNFMWCALAASAPSGSATRFYAVSGGYGPTGSGVSRVMKSDDHGATWQTLASPVLTDGGFHWAYAIAASPTNPNKVYLLDSENQALFTSSNQGANWNNVSANLPTGNSNYNFSQSWYDYHLECGSRVVNAVTKDVLYLGEIDVTESLDEGLSWISLGGPTYISSAISHNDQHCLAVNPVNPDQLIFSNDGGVYSVIYNSSTNTNTVTPLNKNLGATMFYKVAFHPTNASIMIGGSQDNATPISNGDIANWLNVAGGDGGGVGVNQTNPLVQYATVYNLTVLRTDDGWSQHQFDISPSTTAGEVLPFVTPIYISAQNQSLMYTASNYLYRWNEATQSWTNRLGNKQLTSGSNQLVQAITVAPTDGNRIYTGSSDGALFMSKDSGSTWTQLNAGSTPLPTAAITSVMVNPTNSDDILIGLGGTGLGKGHIWRCTNAGTSPVFTSVSGSGASALPDVSVNAIALDIFNPTTTWWTATDVGVFQSNDSGTTWTNAGSASGLPNVIVNDLVAVPGTGYLNAGTNGRGMWRIKLTNPGATLSGITLQPTTVISGNSSTGKVTLTAAAPAGGLVVNLASDTTSAQVPGSVTVAAGATFGTFTVTTSVISSSVIANIKATAASVTVTAALTIQPGSPASVTLAPSTVLSGGTSTGTVTLDGKAGPSGTVVTLTSANTSVATVPSTVTVASGATSATFTVTSLSVVTVQTVDITAAANGASAKATLTVNPANLTSVAIAPTAIVGGNTPTGGTVTLGSAAPTGGALVTLSSNNSCVTVPGSVTVAAGATTGTFAVKTSGVDVSTQVTVTATYGATSKTGTITVIPAWPFTLAVAPATVVGGGVTIVTATVGLIGQAGPSGTVVSLTSGNTAAATVPASVTVAAGATKATFTVTTKSVATSQSVLLTATALGKSATTTLTVNPSNLQSVSIAPTTLVGGNTPTGTVTLISAAPTGGAVVLLSASSPSVKVPASVTVAAGATSATFAVPTAGVDANLSATITANLGGATKTCSLTLLPAWILSVTSTPTTIAGGNTASGSANLIGQAGPSGTIVTLSSSNTAVASVPSTVTVSAGAVKAPFVISTSAVLTTQTVTITGTALGKSATVTLTVVPTGLASISVSPATLVGGNTPTGTVTLTGPAPTGGTVVSLSSANSKAVVPASVTVAAGAKTASFAIPTSGVDTSTAIVLTATLGATSKTCTLTLLPAWPMTLTVTPSTVTGGSATVVTGKIALNGRAGPSGIVVTLSTSDDSAASVPVTVTVPANSLSVTFVVTTHAVASTKVVTLTATAQGKSETTTLTVNH